MLQLQALRKSFGEVAALAWSDDAGLDLNDGEIVGVVGENGAGKSTLMAALVGSVHTDAGQMTLNSAQYKPSGPFDALRKGVALVPQESIVSPTLSVADNVLLGREREFTRAGFVAYRRQARLAREALARLSLDDLPLDMMVRDLPLETQKLIELARALASKPRVLLIDETSNVLSGDGVHRLFHETHAFVRRGGSAFYITHHLSEVMTHCDRVAVMRDGELVTVVNSNETDEESLSRLMVGRDIKDAAERHNYEGSTELVLETENLTSEGCRNVSLTVKAGEILGLAGLEDSGSRALARSIMGDIGTTGGKIRVNGKEISRRRSFRRMLRSRVAYIPKNRDVEGLILNHTIRDNMTLLASEQTNSWRPVLPWSRQGDVREQMRRLRVRAPSSTTQVVALSGGNRQKVLLGRYFLADVDVLILDSPTRGVDVGARVDIFQLLDEARKAGKAMLVISDELEELRRVADRLLVMRRGEISAEYTAPIPDDEHLIGDML